MRHPTRTSYLRSDRRGVGLGNVHITSSLGSHWAVSIVFGCLALLNVTPVLSSFGTPLSIAAASAAVFNPFAAFLFVAGSQIAPDPQGFPLTLAQMFVAAWVVTLPFNGCLSGFSAIPAGMRYAIAFILMWTAIGLTNGTVSEALVYAYVTAAILCAYLPRMHGHYTRGLWMLALGAGLGILGHWGVASGLPMEGRVYEHVARGGVRMGSGRADVNFASVNVGFALWTIVALLLPVAWLSSSSRAWLSRIAVVACIALCSVPLIAMGSRAGLGYLILGGLTLAIYVPLVRSLSGPALTSGLLALLAIFALSPVVWPLFMESAAGQMLVATLDYNRSQAMLVGSEEWDAGRAEIWGKFLNVALQYPLTGVPAGEVVDMGEYGFAEAGGGEGGTGHNVFIDLAAARGFPTAILFAIAFLAPVFALYLRRGAMYALPFVVAHAMVFLPFMNVSIANWKTYWALHVLTAAAAAGKTPRSYARSAHAHGND